MCTGSAEREYLKRVKAWGRNAFLNADKADRADLTDLSVLIRLIRLIRVQIGPISESIYWRVPTPQALKRPIGRFIRLLIKCLAFFSELPPKLAEANKLLRGQ